jgi:hypothetical protein
MILCNFCASQENPENDIVFFKSTVTKAYICEDCVRTAKTILDERTMPIRLTPNTGE